MHPGLRSLMSAGLLVGAGARVYAASGEQVRFSWVRDEGTESCADQQAVSSAVRVILGRDPFSYDAARSVEGVVRRESGAWRVRLHVRDHQGTLLGSRDFASEAENCSDILAASSLAVALAIDPTTTGAPPPPPSASSAGTTTPAYRPPAQISSRLPPSIPSTPPVETKEAVGVGLRGIATLGLVPGLAPGLAWTNRIPVADWLSASIGVLWVPEQKIVSEVAGFGITSAWIGFCPRTLFHARSIELAYCGLVYAGAMHSVAYSYQPTFPGDRAWTAVGIQGVFRWAPSNRLYVEAGPEAAFPLIRFKYFVRGRDGAVYQQRGLAGSAFLGLGIVF